MDIVTEKRCTKCGEVKLRSDFPKRNNRPCGYRPICKSCANQYRRAWRVKNLIHVGEYGYAWYNAIKDDPSYKTSQQQKSRKWREENHERFCEQFIKRRREHPEKIAVYCENRRARKKATDGTITVSQWQEIVSDYHGRCAYCGCRTSVVMDHVVPLSRGGSNDIGNIAPVCDYCNSSKGSKPLLIWMYWRVNR